jgi:hypothetical protein
MMKKFIGVVLALVLLGFISLMLLISTATGQKIFLSFSDDEVTSFYFKQDNKTTAYMKGVIYAETHNDIKRLFNDNPEVKTLVLEDVPGSIDDEVNLAASFEIHKRGIATHIPADGFVASGGTDMFLAGVQRTIEPGAKLGVHSWAGLFVTATDFEKSAEEHQPYLDYYRDINIPENFYWYTLEAAPAEGIHWMTMAEIQQYHVVTSLVDTSRLIANLRTLAHDDMKGRGTGDNEATQALILNNFKQYNLKAFNDSFTQKFSFTDEKTNQSRLGTNVIGYLEGSESPNEYMVIGAHYDHMGVVEGKIFNGADDNASGTSAMLSLVEYFAQYPPKHSIIFAAYDAEELGLHGSRNFVDNSPIALEQIKVKFNFDMIGRNINNEIYIVGTHQYPQFKSILKSAENNIALTVSYGHDDPNDETKDYWMESSDNAHYFLNGIPNITFSEEDHPDYHKDSDEFSGIDQEYYTKVVQLIIKSISQVDASLDNLTEEK